MLTLVFIILLQLDESSTPTSTTTNANGGRGMVNTPSNGGRSGGLNTPRSGGKSGGLNTQSQPVAIPPSEPSWNPTSQPAIYEVESDTTLEPAIYKVPSDTAPDPLSQPALHIASQPTPETPSQSTSQLLKTTNWATAIRAATHYGYRPNVSNVSFFINPKP